MPVVGSLSKSCCTADIEVTTGVVEEVLLGAAAVDIAGLTVVVVDATVLLGDVIVVVVAGLTVVEVDMSVVVGDAIVVVGDAIVVVVVVVVVEGGVFSTNDIVNNPPAPEFASDIMKSPAAVQDVADGHDTEIEDEFGVALCAPIGKMAGRASSHTPFVDVMVNAAFPPLTIPNVPAAVQFPGDAHETEVKLASGGSFWAPIGKMAGRASSHTPFVDVMVNAAFPPLTIPNFPTAVQCPGDAHDTEANSVTVLKGPAVSGKMAGRASSHTVFVDVMVNASWEPSLVLNLPTMVQFPGDVHDTELRIPLGSSLWTPSGNSTGRASAHTPFVDVMVNASSKSSKLANEPMAVQFPAVAQDTDVNLAIGEFGWIPLAKTAGRASSHAPFVDVIVNASREPSKFLKFPTAVQFPGDVHDTELRIPLGSSL